MLWIFCIMACLVWQCSTIPSETDWSRTHGWWNRQPLAHSGPETLSGVSQQDCNCVDIRLCPETRRMIYSQTFDRNFLRNITCAFQGFIPFVCCNRVLAAVITTAAPQDGGGHSRDSNFTIDSRATEDSLLKKRWLLPLEDCGQSTDERIVGGKRAALGAYPWVARIGYTRVSSGRVVFRCGGSLINDRYVITAAHCVTKLPGGLQLSVIRLGDVDDRSDPDCNQLECADPVQDYEPIEVKVHPDYDKPRYKNDVALVRLDRPVNITNYVSPICLPFDSLSLKDFTGLKAVVAGWGATSLGISNGSPTLQWVRLSVVPTAECAAKFAARAKIAIGPGQLCAGGESGRDSCEGDSGGPLIRPEQPDVLSPPRFFLVGIVSFGSKNCGFDHLPGVYTRVGLYMDWVLESIQP